MITFLFRRLEVKRLSGIDFQDGVNASSGEEILAFGSPLKTRIHLKEEQEVVSRYQCGVS